MTTSVYPNDDARWEAMRAKDRAAEGAFYIGVHTTGVYCVASCGGRPLRKNVAFYESRERARAAGLRACLRCKPDMQRETLRWGVVETSLGLALVARSDAGLRLVTLGDEAETLKADLEKRFKYARIVRDEAGLAADLAAVARLVDHPGPAPDLPIDAQGTDLQKAVWAALRAIPVGQTASYADIAKAIGRPSAARAVAQACGANPLAVITPCHRVVRADGGLSGYRWGAERKAALLALEGGAGSRVTLDWTRISAELDARGWALTGPLLKPETCAGIADLYPRDEGFRSRVVMARHGFGRGEYKYFNYPLPDVVQRLRQGLYGPLSQVANRWAERLGEERRFPDSLDDMLARCREAGQTRPTPLLLTYGTGDYNCLHQDLYGEHVFPLQAAFLLDAPGRDFEGGEFVLVEQRPRQQSAPQVVPLRQGEGVIFAVRERPAEGVRGVHRRVLRHGVSEIRSGRRRTLGVIFHDAT